MKVDERLTIAREARAFARAEFRVDEDGNPVFEGYATVYDTPYEVAGGPPWGWVETIASGACDKSVREKDDVRLLVNHEGVPLARTKSKTLTLESDKVGLRCEAALDKTNPTVLELVSAMERGDLDEMSFAFRVIRQEWNDDYTERTIKEVKLFDVAPVTFPANKATVAQLRDALDLLREERTGTRRAMPLTFARAVADSLRARA